MSSKTMISISEYANTEPCLKHKISHRRADKIIIHDGSSWEMGCIHNEKELEDMLSYLELEMEKIDENEDFYLGKVAYYKLNKEIINDKSGGFWSLEDLKEKTNNRELKKIKGLSNGSVVDCYVDISDKTIKVYRPNSNSKEVYKKMDLSTGINFRKNNWYL